MADYGTVDAGRVIAALPFLSPLKNEPSTDEETLAAVPESHVPNCGQVIHLYGFTTGLTSEVPQAPFGQEWTVTGVEFREVDVNAADDGSRAVRS